MKLRRKKKTNQATNHEQKKKNKEKDLSIYVLRRLFLQKVLTVFPFSFL